MTSQQQPPWADQPHPVGQSHALVDQPRAVDQPHHPQPEAGNRLRLVAVASVAALAVVLPLASATTGPHTGGRARGEVGHGVSHPGTATNGEPRPGAGNDDRPGI